MDRPHHLLRLHSEDRQTGINRPARISTAPGFAFAYSGAFSLRRPCAKRRHRKAASPRFAIDLLAPEPRNPGASEPRNPGASEPRNLGASEPRNLGASEPRNPGASEPRNLGTSEPRSLGTSEPRNLGTSEPRNIPSPLIAPHVFSSQGGDSLRLRVNGVLHGDSRGYWAADAKKRASACPDRRAIA